MLYILNTSIITGYGSYNYESIAENRVAAEMGYYGFKSAIGHQGAADAINARLNEYGLNVEVNRIQVKMATGDMAIVFKLKARIPEGTILTREEVENVGFEWGLITRTA